MAKGVRHAIIGDELQILSILSSVEKLHFDSLPDTFHGKTPRYTECEIREYIENGGAFFFVTANEQDEITGVLVCWFNETQNDQLFADSKSLWIDTNCVKEQYRGKGYGKMLLDYTK